MHTKAAETLSAYPRARQTGKKKESVLVFSGLERKLERKALLRRTQQRPYNDLNSNLKTSCCNFMETLSRMWRMSSRCQHALPRAFHLLSVRGLTGDWNVTKCEEKFFFCVCVAFCLCVVCLMINQQANWHRGGIWPLVGATPKLSKVLKAPLLHAFFI